MIINSHYAVELLARERGADFLRDAERYRLVRSAHRANRANRKARRSNRRTPVGDVGLPAQPAPVVRTPKQPTW